MTRLKRIERLKALTGHSTIEWNTDLFFAIVRTIANKGYTMDRTATHLIITGKDFEFTQKLGEDEEKTWLEGLCKAAAKIKVNENY